MLDNQKVLLDKVNIVRNVTNEFKKFVSIVKFSWCREGMGLIVLFKWTEVLNLLLMQKWEQVGEVGLYYILCIRIDRLIDGWLG